MPTKTTLRLLLLATLIVACDKGPTKTAPAPATTPTPTATAAKAAEPAGGGKTFGAAISVADTTPIGAILTDPASFKGKVVRVEGMITDVCEMRGCWMALAGDAPGQTLRFKVTDGEMVFPVEAKGKWAVAQGAVAVNELTLEQTKANAAEEAREKGQAFDPATVTKPTTIVRLDGIGAIVRDKK
jgi:hypothetical protein